MRAVCRIMRAWVRPPVAALNAVSKSLGLRTPRDWTSIPNNGATASVSFKLLVPPGSAGFQRTPTRVSLGTVSFRSSSRFPAKSDAMFVSPVMFPPGRARLAMSPLATGSPPVVMTMGTVLVACLAARAPSCPWLLSHPPSSGPARPLHRQGAPISLRRLGAR